MYQYLRARIVLVTMLLATSASTQAAFHLWQVNEVYSNASGTVQFIEFSTSFGSQQFVQGHIISSSQGGITNQFVIPGNLPSDTTGKKFLIGTAGYAALPGVPAPDYIVPNGFVFTSNVTITFSGCCSAGPLTVPIDGNLSVSNFGATATNSPTNFAGVTGTVVLAPQSTVPNAPTIGTATPGNGQAMIAFASGTDGGSPITGFTATCSSTGQATRTGNGTGSPVLVVSLINGTAYACSVTATNAIGTGTASAAVNVMPSTTPDIPLITSAIGGDTQATISFTPSFDGGSAVTQFNVTCSASGQQTRTVTGGQTTVTVTSLVNGIQYACTVSATNTNGTGPAASANVTPATTITVPGAPTINFASAGNTQATVNFNAPTNDGGAAITSYTATCGTASASGPVSPLTVPGLSNGTLYSCTVAAVNSAGTGAPSAARTVTPGTVAGAPVITSTIAGNAQASIFFSAPASDGGNAIVNYGVSCNPGQLIGAGSGSPITVTGMTNDINYSCTATAINAFGPGTQSAAAGITPTLLAPLSLIAVVTRKTHGATGTFDLPVDSTQAITANVSVEPRGIGNGHIVVYQFNNTINAAGTVAVVDGTGATVGASTTAAGTEVLVTIPALADSKRITVTLTGVNGLLNPAPASIGFLVGDVNSTRSVNSSDISAVKARSGQATTILNFKFDVNATGGVNSSDISAVKARSGLSLP